MGWPSYSSLEISFLSQPLAPPSSAQDETISVYAADIPELCARDVAEITHKSQTQTVPNHVDAQVTFLPTQAQAFWHFGAEQHLASKLSLEASPASKESTFAGPKPSIKGAQTISKMTFGYWVHNINENDLVLLRLASFRPKTSETEAVIVKELACILRAAQAEAAAWNLQHVVIWNPDELIQKAFKLVFGQEPVVRTRTEGSIPCLRWKNGEDVKVEWLLNEKFNWC